MPNDREMLEQARATLKEQSEILERLGKESLSLGVVIAKPEKGKALLDCGGVFKLVEDPGVDVGKTVTLVPMSNQILGVLKNPPMIGDEVTVVKTLASGSVEISANGQIHAVLPGNATGLKRGDKVLVDRTKSVVLDVIERVVEVKPKLTAPVLWSDIGGNRLAIQALREAIELPRKHPELFKQYKHRPASGILVYGPPGCGKTMLGKASATAMAKGAPGGFISIKGPEVLDPYVGVTEMSIREAYEKARAYFQQNGHEAIVFVDEAESLLAKRGTHGNYMGQTVVPTFLTEMDGLESTPVMTILSTNRPEILDPAVLRDGRIDHKIKIDRPDRSDGETIIDLYLSRTRVAEKGLASFTADRVYETDLPYSGALLEGVVAKAKTSAMRRDIKSGKTTGVTRDDLHGAVAQVVKQESEANQYRG